MSRTGRVERQTSESKVLVEVDLASGEQRIVAGGHADLVELAVGIQIEAYRAGQATGAEAVAG